MKAATLPMEAFNESLFMKACRCEKTSRTPVWLMRQAGRFMKEYRDLRARHAFIDLCKDSDLAAQVTVDAVKKLDVDAAIIFSDILLILEPLGVHVEYTKGEGPVIQNPVRSWDDFKRFKANAFVLEKLSFVFDAVRKSRWALPEGIPLIGFSGAPFTLVSYLIEGCGSRDYTRTKSLMTQEPDTWNGMMTIISNALIAYLNGQIEAGAQAVQIFDSWAGCLTPEEYKKFILPHSHWIIKHLKKGVPVIHFGTQTASLLGLMKEAGGDVIGVDWRIGLDEAWKHLGEGIGIMGNLNPAFLLESLPAIKTEVQRILSEAKGRPGHIFNLGHGVLPETPVEHVQAMVRMVKELSVR